MHGEEKQMTELNSSQTHCTNCQKIIWYDNAYESCGWLCRKCWDE